LCPAITATRPDPDFCQRKGHIVHNHQNVLQANLFFVHPVLYGLSAQVHIGGGTNANKNLTLPFYIRHISQSVLPQCAAMLLHKGHHHIKANVVTGVGIFSTYIA
jgi:hypothetical protein